MGRRRATAAALLLHGQHAEVRGGQGARQTARQGSIRFFQTDDSSTKMRHRRATPRLAKGADV